VAPGFLRLGRSLNTYVGYDLSDSTYTDATTITGDSIFEQTEQTYDAASNAIQTTSRARYHSATGTGSLGSPTSTQPKARVTYVAAYPDALGRMVAVADYGTNGGTALSRSATIPARSDTCLVTTTTFDAAGNQQTATDPAGLVTQLTFDALGRETERVQNPVTSSSSSSSSSSSNTCGPGDDQNVTVQTAYTADGQVSTITAVNANTGNQTTQYVYGTTLTDSAIASSLLKAAEVYPDSVDSDDRIKFTYNRQGEVVTKTDQNGTVHSFDFDKLGRRTQNRVTTLGTGVDGAVKRIATTFEVRGMVQNITSYDNATVGSGSIVNDVQRTYNSFGQATADYQSHSGAVNVATTPKVQYAYLSGSANSIRPTSMTYPNGRVLTYSYGTAGGANDALSRIAALVDNDGTTQLAAYQYLGLGTVVEVDYTQPDIKYTLIDLSSTNDPDTGDIYSGLDRFGRVKDCRWYNYGTSADAARIKHGYDRAGNRLYREDPVATSNSKAFDELYAYDAIYRLRDMQRGTLNGSKTAITAGTRTFEQCWTLDPTGNWKGFREDSDGNGTWDLVQSRTDNKVNEITGISNSVGSAWATPAYNRAGNMTTVPQPADPTKGYTATYDAWHRLVKLVDVPTGQTVQENAYDGRTFRVVRKSYTAGVLSETRQLFYSTGWQVVEERVGAATAAERQFVWGLRYIDELVVRDRDTTGGGTLNERLYALHDANWNVVALANSSGTIQERYAYSAYGVPAVLTAAFGARGTSSYAWEVLYCGYRWEATCAIYLIRHRIYNCQLGRWLKRDPYRSRATTINLQGYVNDRPITFTDSTGLFKEPSRISCAAYQTGFESTRGDTNAVRQRALEFDKKASGWDSCMDLILFLRERSKGNRCIGQLRLHGHGHKSYGPKKGLPGSQGKYPDGKEPDNNPNPDGDLAIGIYLPGFPKLGQKDINAGACTTRTLSNEVKKGQIKFCKNKCVIILYFCRIGDEFAGELASITGCRVYYSRGICSPVKNPNKPGQDLPGVAVSGPNVEEDWKTPNGPSWDAMEPQNWGDDPPWFTEPAQGSGTNTLTPESE
jgi:RHS repeat-associated protein